MLLLYYDYFLDNPPTVLSKFPFSCAVAEEMSVIFTFSISAKSVGSGDRACTWKLTKFELDTGTYYNLGLFFHLEMNTFL